MALGKIAQKIFGSQNDRHIKKYQSRVQHINALEAEMEALSDEDLRAKSDEFKAILASGKTLDDILEPAFAVVREAAKRTLGQRHYDVQLIGGMVLHDGNIAEMRTGEGKTLVATLAVYLNALKEQGVHVVTVNDYLAQRDANWMGQVYHFLGMTTGVIVAGLSPEERYKAYRCDITYGTNNEFGFDYLRDNMEHELAGMVQREHSFAIVDEVDSILIDEARTPLIISGPLEDKTELYHQIDALVPFIEDHHYEMDEKQRSVTLSEEGNEFLEEKLRGSGLLKQSNLYDIENVGIVHHIAQALLAHKMFERDKDYIIRNNQVMLIDEFTGRMMEGRRLGNGLHQAIEAKERVAIQPESQTYASVTYQNYFRLYDKLAGMTGTAMTEASEFYDIYALDVIEIPTNVDVKRQDYDDEVYRSMEEKYDAVVKLIEECVAHQQPVLVGTTSIAKSELLSERLKKSKIDHHVLNARYHEQEAQIIAQAGILGAVTIATNMAGRGTDIQLGGNLEMRIQDETQDISDEKKREAKIAEIEADVNAKKALVKEAGGLYVIGTERHESRRIDNQLRGRSGRQGDPGASKFFLSLEDDLLRIFAAERVEKILNWAGMENGEAISHRFVNKALETSQRKLEEHNYEIRKNILKYDDVVNEQRKAIFEQRKEIMGANDIHEIVREMREQAIEDMVHSYIPPRSYPEEWDAEGLEKEAQHILNLAIPVKEWAEEEGAAEDEVLENIIKAAEQAAAQIALQATPEMMRRIEKFVLLRTLDMQWREHISTLDSLRQVIHWRGLAQRDPLNEFKSESFQLFEILLSDLRKHVIFQLMRVEVDFEAQAAQQQQREEQAAEAQKTRQSWKNTPAEKGKTSSERNPNDPKTWGRVGRNEACPCNSGKKYKQCHGKLG